MKIVGRKIFKDLRSIVKSSQTEADFLERCKEHGWYDPTDGQEAYFRDFDKLKRFFSSWHTTYRQFRNTTVDFMEVFVDPFFSDSLKIAELQRTVGRINPHVFSDVSNVYDRYLENNNWKPIEKVPDKIKERVNEVLPSNCTKMSVFALSRKVSNYTTDELEEKEYLDHFGEMKIAKFPKKIEGEKWIETGNICNHIRNAQKEGKVYVDNMMDVN